MTGQTPNEQALSDQLAEFTDKLLGGDTTGVEGMIAEPKLQETVLLIRQTFGEVKQPEPAMAQRIQRALDREWVRIERESRSARSSFKLSDLFNFRIAQPAVGLAVAALVVIIFVGVLAPGVDGGSMTGAAMGRWPLVAGGVLIGGFLIWLLARDNA